MTAPISTRIDTSPLIAGATVIGNTGYGLLAEDIIDQTATGDSGAGSLYLNALNPAHAGRELRMYVPTWPTVGTLEIDENGAVLWTGLADGIHSFDYQFFVDGVYQGTSTFTAQVGDVAQLVTVASSRQANTCSPVVIKQTHKVGVASSTQGNHASPVTVTQSDLVAAASSVQANHASPVGIKQTHLLTVASSAQGNHASPVAIDAGHSNSVTVANSRQGNSASPVAIRQTHLLMVANSRQANISQNLSNVLTPGRLNLTIAPVALLSVTIARKATLSVRILPI